MAPRDASLLAPPTLADLWAARRRIRPYLNPTPLYRYPSLDATAGCEVWIKHENHLPTGAFKVRGGINLLAQLSSDERRRGVIAASTGNHGQSIAYAARLFDVRAVICVPEGANPVKVEAMRAWGAALIFHGRDFDDARLHCEMLAEREGYRYIHSGNEPALIAGVGTAALEILEERPDVEAILVPIGGGTAAAGACIAARGLRLPVRVLGAQSAAAPAGYESWRARRLVSAGMATFAEGLATRSAFALPQRILWEQLDDFTLVSDDEIRRAMLCLLEKTHNVIEAAGAAPLAALWRWQAELAGKRVALLCTGGNASPSQLRDLLAGEAPAR